MSSPRAPRKLAVGMVGLPARGKTYMAQKLAYYLNWMQVRMSCVDPNPLLYR